MGLPDLFSRWFESRGWTPRKHQLALIELAKSGSSALLIAPTGGGKTLAGFLPSLIELTERRRAGKDLAHAKGKGELHTLYISPLKALATDIRRNLEMPIAEMDAVAGARREPHRRHAAEPPAASARAAT